MEGEGEESLGHGCGDIDPSVQPFRFLIRTRSFTTHNFKIPKTLTLINHLRSILLKSIPTIKKIVNNNQSAPYDTTSHALCRNLASEMLHPSRVSSEFGLNALYDSVNGGGDVWINENCFRIPFKRYVKIGRVAQINYGKEYGRLIVIVDVIDQNKMLRPSERRVYGAGNSLSEREGHPSMILIALDDQPCSNPDCLYLHEIGSQEDSFTKYEIISAYTRYFSNLK
ncbi:putative 60S ribosomal protein L14 [Glycine soja]